MQFADPEDRASWLLDAAFICDGQNTEAEQTYRHYASTNGIQEELDRAILIRDVEVRLFHGNPLQSNDNFSQISPPPAREKLARNLLILFLNLEKDHSSDDAQTCLDSDGEDLVEGLLVALHILVPPKRTKLNETQITSIVRALLELSGGRVDARQHRFDGEYTASENADLCASLFDIPRTNQSGDVNSKEMCNTLSKSPMFFEVTTSAQDLEGWIIKTMDSLYLGFQEGYLV